MIKRKLNEIFKYKKDTIITYSSKTYEFEFFIDKCDYCYFNNDYIFNCKQCISNCNGLYFNAINNEYTIK